MKRRVKRKGTKLVRKNRAKPAGKKSKKVMRKVLQIIKKKQPKRERNLIKKLERVAKKRGVSLFTYVRKSRFKKSKNY